MGLDFSAHTRESNLVRQTSWDICEVLLGVTEPIDNSNLPVLTK